MKKTIITAVLAAAFAASASADVICTSYFNKDGSTLDQIGDGTSYTVQNLTYASGAAGARQSTLVVTVDLYTLAKDMIELGDAATSQQTLTEIRASSASDTASIRQISAKVDASGDIVVCATQTDDAKGRLYTTSVNINDDTTYSKGDVLVLTMVMGTPDTNKGVFYVYDGEDLTASTIDAGSSSTTGEASSYLYGANFGTLNFGSDLGNNVLNAYVYNAALTGDALSTAVSVAYNAAVPEPTTATLSLLSLAGLAARRRRK